MDSICMFNCVNDEYGRVTTEDVKTGDWEPTNTF